MLGTLLSEGLTQITLGEGLPTEPYPNEGVFMRGCTFKERKSHTKAQPTVGWTVAKFLCFYLGVLGDFA